MNTLFTQTFNMNHMCNQKNLTECNISWGGQLFKDTVPMGMTYLKYEMKVTKNRTYKKFFWRRTHEKLICHIYTNMYNEWYTCSLIVFYMSAGTQPLAVLVFNWRISTTFNHHIKEVPTTTFWSGLILCLIINALYIP